MNHLAHLRLANPSDEARLGNLLGDFVKGCLANHSDRYSPVILQGIQTHRDIDQFTDRHPVHCRSRQRLQPPYRRLAGIIIDISYDHFLTRNWHHFYANSLDQFIDDIYQLLWRDRDRLPESLQRALPTMIQQNWLGDCRTMAGVDRTFARVARRFKRPTCLATAGQEVMQHYDDLEQDFLDFFPRLMHYAKELQRDL
ncbi:ACP phosphodiesterase [Leptolyngbya sp. CCY15150]|uniref:acyl carrier protein phosphodiesterase n=1 Tax=Leptolyngbya sp. CCY15150 TaxID=2767772 RepID=UPI0019506534|nr:ACP phosphodiesterase [Leptolyngbya sp. CCY15150]